MTAIAIWRNAHHLTLWAVADTRISADLGTGSGGAVRTDSGSKLFSLPVVCRVPYDGTNEVYPEAHYQTSYGFAFSGNTLPALMTYAMASNCLENLRGDAGHSEPLSLREVSEFVRRLGSHFGRSVAESRNKLKLDFDLIIFGLCPRLRAYAIYHLRSLDEEGLELGIKETLPRIGDPPAVFGSGGDVLKSELRNAAEEHDPFSRLPLTALRRIIDREARRDVGGGISLGICFRNGFRLLSSPRRLEPDKPLSVMTFNGMDTDLFGQVGTYDVGITGII